MTKQTIPRLMPPLLQPGRFANNGQRPQAPALWRVATGLCHIQHYARKGVSFGMGLGSALGTLTDVVHGFGFILTGEGTTKLRLYLGFGPTSLGPPSDSYVYLTATPYPSGSVITSEEIHFLRYGASVDAVAPDELFDAEVSIDVAPNTEYELALHRVDYAVVHYWTVVEHPEGGTVEDSGDGLATMVPYVTEGPIYDTHARDPLEAADLLHRHNGKHLFAWTAPPQSAPPGHVAETVTSATYVPWDSTDDASEWYTPVAQDCRLTDPRVPVIWAVRGASAAGSTNAVKLIDDAGAQVAVVSGFNTTAKWKRVVAYLPADTASTKVRAKSDGTNALSIYGMSLLEYDDQVEVLAPSHSLDLEGSSSQLASIADADQTGLDITGTLTLAAWVRLESLPPNGFSYAVTSKWTAAGNQRSYVLSVHQIGGVHTVRLAISDDGTNEHSRAFTWTPSTATWYHLAFSFNPAGSGIANQFAGYLDGAAQTLATVNDDSATAIFNSTSVVELGGNKTPTGGLHFDGMIHSAQIWSRILSAAEVDAIHDDELVGTLMTMPQTGLQAWWCTHDNYGDNTPNGNVLTPAAGPVFSATVP